MDELARPTAFLMVSSDGTRNAPKMSEAGEAEDKRIRA